MILIGCDTNGFLTTFSYLSAMLRFRPSQMMATSGINTADPHTENGAFGAGVEAGLLGVGSVVRVA